MEAIVEKNSAPATSLRAYMIAEDVGGNFGTLFAALAAALVCGPSNRPDHVLVGASLATNVTEASSSLSS